MTVKLKIFLSFLLIGLINYSCFSQYDYIIEAFKLDSQPKPKELRGFFAQKFEITNGRKVEYFMHSNPTVNFIYYPKQDSIDCGYFCINNQIVGIMGNEDDDGLRCDLDYGSFILSTLNLANRNYIILTANRYGSGRTASLVYCHLFETTNPNRILYCPLWSIYGSTSCFGDFNKDGILDFLEIRNNKDYKTGDVYKVIFCTISNNRMVPNPLKHIIFKKEFRENELPKILVLKKNL